MPALLLPAGLAGQDPPPKTVVATANISFVDAAGNTDMTTLSGDQRIEYSPLESGWKLTQFLLAIYGRADGVTSANSLRLGGRADREITDRLAAFGGITYLRNRFSGIARHFEEIAGLAYTVLDRPRDQLSAELGASFNQQRDLLGADNDFVAARAAGAYRHLFTEEAFFQQLVELLPNLEESEDLRINTESSLVAPLSKRLAIKLSYTIRFDNLPEPTFSKTDRIFSSGLQITF